MPTHGKKGDSSYHGLGLFTRRWIIKPIVEIIPSAIGWGLGDMVTAYSAIKKRDVFTGEQLDTIDRLLYWIAALVPFVPSTAIVEPTRLVRRIVEDLARAQARGDKQAFLSTLKDAIFEAIQWRLFG